MGLTAVGLEDAPRFRRLLMNAVLVPLGLMVVVAVLLGVQVADLVGDSSKVARSDLVLAQANQLQTLTIDLESGLRGFLVTGADRFLEPYDRSLAVIGRQSAELSQLAVGRPDQMARVARLDAQRAEWLAYARGQIARRRAGGNYTSVAREGEGKRLMDGMRAGFTGLLRVEGALRDERAADARSASRSTFVLVGLIAVVGGGVLAVAARHQFLELSRTYAAAIIAARDANARLEQRVAERTAELADANGRLGEMNKELEAFAYSISHDLRAPMRHIAGFANLLKMSVGPTLSADDGENLTTIRDTAQLAGRMVDDLLGFSRVGRVTLAVSAVDVGDLVQQCRRELEPDLAGRDVRWDVRPVPLVRGDPALLKMVVRNLLSNAVKYTATRAVATIRVGPADWPAAAAGGPEGDGGVNGGVSIAFADDGVGFDMAYAGKLFGVFQRLHRAEDFAGTGIGLANVKRILLRLGGTVWAQGVPDRGATFYVCLPAAGGPPPPTEPIATEPTATEPTLTPEVP